MSPNEAVEVLLVIAGLVLVWYIAQIAKRKRQVLDFRLRYIGLGLVITFLSHVILARQIQPPWLALAVSICVGSTAAAALVGTQRRSRRIPKRIRKKVIERDLKGKPFDPSQHEIDHIVPFSRGGDHSLENLRVVPKAQNRKRGAKMPGFRDLT